MAQSLSRKTHEFFCLTTHINEAEKFVKYADAEKTLAGLPNQLKPKLLYLRPFNNKFEGIPGKLNDELSPVAYPVSDPKWLEDLKNNFIFVDSTIGKLSQEYASLCEKLNDVNNEVEDIKHAIEFTNLNAVEGCHIEKKSCARP